MLKRLIAFFVLAMIILMPTQIHAQDLEGKVTSLSTGEQAPYAGVLLDPIAASKIIIDQKYLKLEVELELRKEFQQELSSKRLTHDMLRIDYVSLQKIHEETLSLKNNQINDLNTLLQEQAGNNNHHWWLTGGTVVGIVLSVAVFYASVEIAR
jgi:hypothetical protein